MTSLTVRGTLYRQKGARAGDPRAWRVSWPTKKGGTASGTFAPDQLASALRDRTEMEIAVDLDLEQGKPKRIRPTGEAWTASAAPEAALLPSQPQRPQAAASQRDHRGRAPDSRHRNKAGNTHTRDGGAFTTRFNFHNPYNFVPAPSPRTRTGPLADAGDPGSGGLAGHGRYSKDRFSGRISMKITVVTPLLIPDGVRAEEESGHKTFPLRVHRSDDGQWVPCVPPTSIKGMLRAAYEAITNSRLSVFRGHQDPLRYRDQGRKQSYAKSPRDLLHDSLLPAKALPDLSPADRVFGWVNQEGKGAYKGNLRIGPVRLLKAPEEGAIETFQSPLPLAILSRPKPQQARFYVARDANGEPLAADERQVGYRRGQGLRGRKVYPHHKNLPESYWRDALSASDRAPQAIQGNRYREYLRPPSPDARSNQRDDQNRSIEAWVRPQTVFALHVHVTNLTNVELGALLWLLNLPAEHYHRFGGGKPLGFGSVRLELGDDLDLADGAWLESWYSSFGAPASDAAGTQFSRPDDPGLSATVAAFETAVEEAYGNHKRFEETSFIRAFLNAARGIGSDQQPLHYPRVIPRGRAADYPPPRTSGENFKWFGANEKPDRRRALPSLAVKEDQASPLPLYPEAD